MSTEKGAGSWSTTEAELCLAVNNELMNYTKECIVLRLFQYALLWVIIMSFCNRKWSGMFSFIYKKVNWSRYRPGVAQRVGRGIALLFHDRGNRRGWVVSSTPRPHFTPGKDLVPIVQEAEWARGPVWTGGKSRPLGGPVGRSGRAENLVPWMGPWAGLDGRKISSPPRFDPGPSSP